MAVEVHNDFEKLNVLIKIIDESFEYANNATDNIYSMLDDAQAELVNTLDPDMALIYTDALVGINDSYIATLDTQLNALSVWNTIFLTTVKPPPAPDTILQAIIKALANSRIITGVTTLTNGNTAISGVGTAFETEIAAGDYIYRESDGRAYAQRVSSVTDDTTATLAAAYTGTTGTGVIIIERTIQSRNVTKTLTYSDSTGGNRMKVLYYKEDRYGFDRETFRKEGTWRLEVASIYDYTGKIKLSFNDSVTDKGTREDIIDPYGAKEGSEIILPIYNPYNVSTIYSSPIAGQFVYENGTADTLANYGWYSADWTNGVISNTIFKHAKPGTKKPSVWAAGGTGSSLEVTGDLTSTILIDKTRLNQWLPYKILVDYKYDITTYDTNDIDMTFTVGSKTVTFSATGVITGTADFTNTDINVTGTGTKFLSELSPGDCIRATAHAAAVATEIASIESDTSLTLVAGGYLGATTGGAAGATGHYTGWHTGELDLGYMQDFTSEEDCEFEVDFDFTAGQLNVDNISPVALTVVPQLATAIIFWAGEENNDWQDYWEWDIALVGSDSKTQRWYVEKFNVSLPHRSTNPTFADPT